jgi:Rrf2 family cysteine metabolism transcriptional repressor
VFALRKTTTYALISLAHMANRPSDCVSAREIAVARDLPQPLLMKVLKVMHGAGILRSERGVKGGYQIATNLEELSLYDLTNHLQSGLTDQGEDVFRARKRRSWLGTDAKPSPAPILALQYRLIDYLDRVKVADLVLPGRRIEVPVERVRLRRTKPPKATTELNQTDLLVTT